ncbi:SDR family oxidoreductase [candidate division WOR-3 bacterium]|nr:SDR family oxidoreductase [candidate division WOR-3 bacterium]
MKLRILIVGASGFIGYHLFEEFSKHHQVLGTFYNHPASDFIHLDVKDKVEIDEVLTSFLPDVIIYPAANPNVEYCETHPEETWEVNVKGTANTLEIAKKIKAKFIFFSSDYIFDGKEGPYLEEDNPNPINVYGRQKLASEELIKESLMDYLIIRTTVVFGWERNRKNFIMQMIHALKNGETMEVPEDQVGTPTYVKNLCLATRELIEKDKTGFYNISGKDLIDRYNFARIAATIFSLNENLLIPVSLSEFREGVPIPIKAGLKIEKAQYELETELLGVKEGLEIAKIDIERRIINK